MVAALFLGAGCVSDSGYDSPPSQPLLTEDDLGAADWLAEDEGEVNRVCLVPGHPCVDWDYSKAYEGIINRKVAFYLEDMLVEAGHEVLIVTDDLTEEELFAEGFDNEDPDQHARLGILDLDERAALCNDFDADYLISIHHNDVEDSSVNYSLVLYNQPEPEPEPEPDLIGARFPESVDWARRTAEYLGNTMEVSHADAVGDMHYLGFRLRVLRLANMPGILTEGSFYSNPAERQRLNDNDYLYGEADALFRAFEDTFR
jgi:N-acetylmuramoyl-L-alanine amidase